MKPYDLHSKKSPVWDFASKGLVISKSKKHARHQAKIEIQKDLMYYDYYHMPFHEQPWNFEDYEEIEKD